VDICQQVSPAWQCVPLWWCDLVARRVHGRVACTHRCWRARSLQRRVLPPQHAWGPLRARTSLRRGTGLARRTAMARCVGRETWRRPDGTWPADSPHRRLHETPENRSCVPHGVAKLSRTRSRKPILSYLPGTLQWGERGQAARKDTRTGDRTAGAAPQGRPGHRGGRGQRAKARGHGPEGQGPRTGDQGGGLEGGREGLSRPLLRARQAVARRRYSGREKVVRAQEG
jgi:hypothetical protein